MLYCIYKGRPPPDSQYSTVTTGSIATPPQKAPQGIQEMIRGCLCPSPADRLDSEGMFKQAIGVLEGSIPLLDPISEPVEAGSINTGDGGSGPSSTATFVRRTADGSGSAEERLASGYKLGHSLSKQGKHAEAETVFRENLELRKEVLGRKHTDTLNAEYWLAYSLHHREQYAKAETIFRENLELRTETLGRKSTATLNTQHWLARSIFDQKQYIGAETVFRENLELRIEVLGRKNTDTLLSMYWLASTLHMQQEYAEAEPVFRENLELRKEVLGRKHTDTLNAEYLLAYSL